eukprot:529713-Prorocentrum_minimum.AAC.1
MPSLLVLFHVSVSSFTVIASLVIKTKKTSRPTFLIAFVLSVFIRVFGCSVMGGRVRSLVHRFSFRLSRVLTVLVLNTCVFLPSAVV